MSVTSSHNLFRVNLDILSKIIPDAAQCVESAGAGEWVTKATRVGEANLQKGDHLLHASYSADEEAKRWWKNLELERCDTLFIYGVGLGHSFSYCKRWLEEDHHRSVVYLEDDPSILWHFLHTETASQVLLDKQVQIHYWDERAPEGMLSWLGWYFVQASAEVAILTSYQRHRKERAHEIGKRLLHELVSKSQAAAEYLRHGSSFYLNFYSNSLALPESYLGNQLCGQFRGVPAVICGAGPSLDKNGHLLQELKERALIFAGGSSVNALSSRGLQAHFGGGIDPNPTQLERLSTHQSFELPYFYRARMHHQALRTIQGPRLYMTGTGGYATASYLEQRLGIEGYEVDEGCNVINFLTEVARALGCNPIIFVGMDLAYSNMNAYAGGVVGKSQVEEQQILGAADLEGGAFLRSDIYGKPVYTLWKWIAESEWITNFSRRFSALRILNATEGGLGFDEIPNCTLQQVLEQLPPQQDLSGRVHAAIHSMASQQVDQAALLHELASLRKSLDRSVASLRTESSSEKLFQEIQKEEAYPAILSVFDEIFCKVQQRKRFQEVQHAEKRVKSDIEEMFEKQRLQFLKEVAETNLRVLKKAVDLHGDQEALQTIFGGTGVPYEAGTLRHH